jgi:hypothetical protein
VRVGALLGLELRLLLDGRPLDIPEELAFGIVESFNDVALGARCLLRCCYCVVTVKSMLLCRCFLPYRFVCCIVAVGCWLLAKCLHSGKSSHSML